MATRRTTAKPRAATGRVGTPAAVTRYRKAHGFDLNAGWPPSLEQQARARHWIGYNKDRYDDTQNPVYTGRRTPKPAAPV